MLGRSLQSARSLSSTFYRCRSTTKKSFSRVDTMYFQSPSQRDERLRHDINTFSSKNQFQNFGLVFLGSGGGKLDNTRSSPSVAVRFDGVSGLVDCGNDTARELMNASMWSIPGMRASRFQHIFVTHLHADHIMGILATLLVLKQSFEDKCPSFHLWGPVGLRKFVRSALAVTNPDISVMELCIHELVTLKEYQIYERMFMESRSEGSGPRTKFSIPLHPCGDTLIVQNQKTKAWDLISPQKKSLPTPPWSHYQPVSPPKIPNVAVTAGEIRHTVRTHGFVFEEITKKNNYLVEEGEKRGINARTDYQYIKQLKLGETVTLPSGVVVTPEEVIAKGRKGRKMTILGDTSDASWMLNAARDSDLIVHEATVSVTKPTGQAYGHSTGRDAGKFARACGARHLVLNHLCDRGDSMVLDEYVNEAQAQFDGPVIPAVDQLIVDINQEGREDIKIGEEAENIVEVERVGLVPKQSANEWVDYSKQVYEKVYPKRVPNPSNAFVENNEENEEIEN